MRSLLLSVVFVSTILLLISCSDDPNPEKEDNSIQLTDVESLDPSAQLARGHHVGISPFGEIFYWVGFWDPETTLIGNFQIRNILSPGEDQVILDRSGAYTWSTTSTRAIYKNLSVSPEGKSLVYFYWKTTGENLSGKLRVDDGKVTELESNLPGHIRTIYHMSEDEIVYSFMSNSSADTSQSQVYIHNVSGGEKRTLFKSINGYVELVTVNKKTQQILINHWHHTKSEVLILDFDGNILFQYDLANSDAFVKAVDLSPDGNQIVIEVDYRITDGPTPFIEIIDVATAQKNTLLKRDKNSIYLNDVYGFSPDGSKILFNSSFDSEFSHGTREENRYFRQLHFLDLNTGEVDRIPTEIDIAEFYGFHKNNGNQFLVRGRINHQDPGHLFLISQN